MKRHFLLALMLASGMALAQSNGSSGSQDQQQPSTQPSQPSSQQPSTDQQQPSSQQPSGQQPSTQPSQPSDQSSQTSAGSNSLKGCLQQSGENFVLITDQGQSTPLSGDGSTLKPHNGHQVQVNGKQASDGSFQVTDVTMIAETCQKQQASDNSSGMGAAAGATAGAAGGAAASGADATKSAASDTADAAKGAASDTASAAQGAPSSQTSPSSSQSSTTPSTSDQSQPSSAGQIPKTSDQQTPSTSDQGVQAGATGKGKKLPQTASPLPLLGLLGLGSLVSGLISRRKK